MKRQEDLVTNKDKNKESSTEGHPQPSTSKPQEDLPSSSTSSSSTGGGGGGGPINFGDASQYEEVSPIGTGLVKMIN